MTAALVAGAASCAAVFAGRLIGWQFPQNRTCNGWVARETLLRASEPVKVSTFFSPSD